MATLEFPIHRLMLVGGFAAAIAVTPTIAYLAGPEPTINTPVAACPHGEYEDLYTLNCVPELVPNTPGGMSQQQFEQDVLDTPGFTSPNVGGTTVP